MRCLLLTVGLLIASLSCDAVVQADQAPEQVTGETLPAPIVITAELVEAHHAFQLAQLRWQKYRFVELPRQRQLLDDQVRLAESEVRVLRRRLRDYRPFLQVGRYSPVRTAAENNRLSLQAVEQNARQLKNEQINLMRYSWQNSQLYQLDVLRTAARVRAIMTAAQVTRDP